ncbi:hypothetical protein HYT84_01400 [Candidatus Micrarchaeota archaeon]|nr:hypothetical protein [Candidatus Micrarchaeota archaeon]
MLNNQILAHRGFWKDRSEQNTLESLVKSLDLGFGIETDLRDRLGEIVISHDPPSEKTQLTLEKMLNTFQDHKNYKNVYYAMNIKADGLERSVIEILDRYGISKNCFVFDMSGPSTILFQQQASFLTFWK